MVEKKKPEIICFYNETKGGVDNFDHLVSLTSCKRKTSRWPLVLFYNMIDTAGIAAFIIWLCNFPQWEAKVHNRRRLFLMQLGQSLVKEHVQRRASDTRKLKKAPIQALVTLGYLDPHEKAKNVTDGHRMRCYMCPRSSDRKYARSCNDCGAKVCPAHSNEVFCKADFKSQCDTALKCVV